MFKFQQMAPTVEEAVAAQKSYGYWNQSAVVSPTVSTGVLGRGYDGASYAAGSKISVGTINFQQRVKIKNMQFAMNAGTFVGIGFSVDNISPILSSAFSGYALGGIVGLGTPEIWPGYLLQQYAGLPAYTATTAQSGNIRLEKMQIYGTIGNNIDNEFVSIQPDAQAYNNLTVYLKVFTAPLPTTNTITLSVEYEVL